MSEQKIPIPAMLYNAAVGGHVANSQQIIDEDYNLEQKDVNKEVLGVPYNSTTPNGMGRIVLKKNDNFKQVVEAQTDGNTIFVIKYDFTLSGNVTVPANCVLEFDGGSISGAYTLTGNNTGIQADLVKIFNTNVTLAGTWNVAEACPEWFGAKGDGATDDTAAIQKAINLDKIIVLSNPNYVLSNLVITGHNFKVNGNGKQITLSSQATGQYLIDGVRVQGGNYSYDIELNEVNFVGLDGNTVEGVINIFEYNNIIIKDCTFTNIADPDTYANINIDIVHAVGYNKMIIENCIFDGGLFRCVQAAGKYTYASNNVFMNANSGISSNEIIYSSTDKDEEHSPEKFFIVNNIFKNLYMVATSCEGGSQASGFTKQCFAYIRNNYIEDVGNNDAGGSWNYAIAVGDGFNGIVCDNTIKDFAVDSQLTDYGDAIVCASGRNISYGYEVYGNTIINAKHNGIYCATPGGNDVPCNVYSNHVSGCDTGIYSTVVYAIISDNVIKGNVTGIRRASTNCKISNNRLHNIDVDISINSPALISIIGNSFTNGSITSYHIKHGDNYKTVSGLTVKGNSFAAAKINNVITNKTPTDFECSNDIVKISGRFLNPTGDTELASFNDGSTVVDFNSHIIWVKVNTEYKQLQFVV